MVTNSGFDRLNDALASAGCNPRRVGTEWVARCPVHGAGGSDTRPSLGFRAGRGQALLLCRAGCTTTDVVDALGLTMADLFDDRRGVTYEYHYADGRKARTVNRTTDKRFYQQDAAQHPPMLYRLPEVVAAVAAGQVVYLVEGEKDADALTDAGVVATTAPMGASNFHKAEVWPLKGARVVVVVDRDEAGARWARVVRTRLSGLAALLTFVQAAEGKDSADHLLYGHGVDDFVPFEPELSPEQDPEPHNEQPQDHHGRRLVARTADTMRMRGVLWLDDGRIPVAALTILGGREGIGKSTVAIDIAARITRGTLPGHLYGKPRKVIIVAAEDAWEETIVPRLEAADADRSKVIQVHAITEDNQLDTVTLPTDLARLKDLCETNEVALIILDPLMSTIHATIDTHKDRDVRKALGPLKDFAEETKAAVIGLLHVNKRESTDAMTSLMASRAFGAVARSVLYCIVDPEEEHEDRYLMCHPKCNVGPKQPSRGYRIGGVKFDVADADQNGGTVTISTSVVRWGDDDSRTANDLLAAGAKAKRPPTGLEQSIAEFVAAQYQETGSAVPQAEVLAEFPDENVNTLKSRLNRMVKDGKLDRPIPSHYVPVSASTASSASAALNASIASEMQ